MIKKRLTFFPFFYDTFAHSRTVRRMKDWEIGVYTRIMIELPHSPWLPTDPVELSHIIGAELRHVKDWLANNKHLILLRSDLGLSSTCPQPDSDLSSVCPGSDSDLSSTCPGSDLGLSSEFTLKNFWKLWILMENCPEFVKNMFYQTKTETIDLDLDLDLDPDLGGPKTQKKSKVEKHDEEAGW